MTHLTSHGHMLCTGAQVHESRVAADATALDDVTTLLPSITLPEALGKDMALVAGCLLKGGHHPSQ